MNLQADRHKRLAGGILKECIFHFPLLFMFQFSDAFIIDPADIHEQV